MQEKLLFILLKKTISELRNPMYKEFKLEILPRIADAYNVC